MNMKTDSLFQNIREKNKDLEDEISKWQNFQIPKIRELEMNQKTLLEEFNKVKKDFDTYSNLYQIEREEKIKAYAELKDERKRFNDLVSILGRERRKIKELKADIIRQDQIILELVDKAPDP